MMNYIDLALAILIMLIVIVLLLIKLKPTKSVVVFSLLVVGLGLALGFKFYNTAVALALISVVYALVFVLLNLQRIRNMLLKKKKVVNNFASDDTYKKMDELVKILSKKKIGAIITFERHDSLEEICKNGTLINAPISVELLETIFYEGTRLHDGAVIIKNNMIYAASVYFTPSTKALNGKYGSRHRAAFGISEITDAITIVVSEETGRIALAYNGNLENVHNEEFYREFTELMEKTK